MTTILERMREELVRRNYAANTIYTYTKIVVEFERYVGKPLEEVDADDLRRTIPIYSTGASWLFALSYSELPLSGFSTARPSSGGT